MPKKLRGERAAQLIIRLKLLEFGIDSYDLKPKSSTDFMAFKPFTRNPAEVRVQVKSCSLGKHGWEMHVDDTPLEEFKGWYIVLIEHNPEDMLLYICDSKLRRYIEENKDNPKLVRRDPKRKRWYVLFPRGLSNFKENLKPDRFIEEVLGIPIENLPDWLRYLNE